MAQVLGSTELRVERQTVSWSIRGVESLFDTKLIPIWKLESPTFETNYDSRTRKWHLQLMQSKNDMMKCTLVEEISMELYRPNFTGRPNSSGSGSRLTDTVRSFSNIRSTSSTGVPRSSLTSIPPTSIPSQMLNESDDAERTSGALVNNVFVITREGRLESFRDIREKYEETTGWKEWAGRFVEKRRKAGFTEYIFGTDEQAYENAVPLNYLLMFPDRYVDNTGNLELHVELVFTSTIKIPVNQNEIDRSPITAADEATIESQKNLNNAILAQRLAGFLKASHLSDFTLECEGRSFPVHKIILEARAPSLLANFLSRPRVVPVRPCDRTPVQIQNQFLSQPFMPKIVGDIAAGESCCSEAGSVCGSRCESDCCSEPGSEYGSECCSDSGSVCGSGCDPGPGSGCNSPVNSPGPGCCTSSGGNSGSGPVLNPGSVCNSDAITASGNGCRTGPGPGPVCGPGPGSGCGDTYSTYCNNDNQTNRTAPNITSGYDHPVCPCISPAFRAQSIVVLIDNMRANVLEIILQFVYLGTLTDNLDIQTLKQVSREARKYNCHDLTYMCFLRCLNSYRNCPPDQVPGVEELMAEIFTTCDCAVFENRSLSILELRQLHPLAFHQLDSLL